MYPLAMQVMQEIGIDIAPALRTVSLSFSLGAG